MLRGKQEAVHGQNAPHNRAGVLVQCAHYFDVHASFVREDAERVQQGLVNGGKFVHVESVEFRVLDVQVVQPEAAGIDTRGGVQQGAAYGTADIHNHPDHGLGVTFQQAIDEFGLQVLNAQNFVLAVCGRYGVSEPAECVQGDRGRRCPGIGCKTAQRCFRDSERVTSDVPGCNGGAAPSIWPAMFLDA